MNLTFAAELGVYVLVYLDDILIFSDSADLHVEHVCTVLQHLRDQSWFAKMPKCEFAALPVKFLGHVVGSG